MLKRSKGRDNWNGIVSDVLGIIMVLRNIADIKYVGKLAISSTIRDIHERKFDERENQAAAVSVNLSVHTVIRQNMKQGENTICHVMCT